MPTLEPAARALFNNDVLAHLKVLQQYDELVYAKIDLAKLGRNGAAARRLKRVMDDRGKEIERLEQARRRRREQGFTPLERELMAIERTTFATGASTAAPPGQGVQGTLPGQTTPPQGAQGVQDTLRKRGPGRPKGSKNRKPRKADAARQHIAPARIDPAQVGETMSVSAVLRMLGAS